MDIIDAASVVAGYRTGAPFSPSAPSMNPGSHNAMVRSPVGAPSSVTATTSCPHSRDAWPAGSAAVAEAKISVGSDPYAFAIRSNLRNTNDTFAPNTPR